MVARLTAMLPVNVRGMWIGTFHGLCNRLCARALPGGRPAAGVPNSGHAGPAFGHQRLCKQFQVDEEKKFPPKQLQWFIAVAREGNAPTRCAHARCRQPQKVEIYQLYEERCQREGVVDFGELMLRSYELLRDQRPLRAHYQRRFRYILVDEFQTPTACSTSGSNSWRVKKTRAAGTPEANVMAVGTTTRASMPSVVRAWAICGDFVRELTCSSKSSWAELPQLQQHPRLGQPPYQPQQPPPGQNLRTTQGAGEPCACTRPAPTWARRSGWSMKSSNW